MTYPVKLYNWSTHSDYIKTLIQEFHIYGHGIELGIDPDEHLQRVLNWTANNSAIVIYSGDIPIGIVGIVPQLQRDPHFPGLSMHTSFTVVMPGYPGATLKLYRALRTVAQLNGADWLCTSKRTSDLTYTLRGHPL